MPKAKKPTAVNLWSNPKAQYWKWSDKKLNEERSKGDFRAVLELLFRQRLQVIIKGPPYEAFAAAFTKFGAFVDQATRNGCGIYFIEDLEPKILKFPELVDLPEECAGRHIQMFLAIDGDTTLEDIKDSWSQIKASRDRLNNLQGVTHASETKLLLLEKIHTGNRKGEGGYGTIAKNLNRKVEEHLRSFVHDMKVESLWTPKFREKMAQGKLSETQWRNLLKKQAYDFKDGYDKAIFILSMFLKDRQDCKEYCSDALEDIKAERPIGSCVGKAKYSKPIAPEMVRQKLKSFREKYKS